MAEFLRPDADISIGGWTTQSGSTTNLFDALNESSPDDNDYIISSPDPVADIYRFRISDPSSILEDGTVRYRYEKIGSGIGDLIARLIQGNFPTTWNPSDKSSNITLSGSDLTTTNTSNANSGIRTVAAFSSGKKYAELTLTTAPDIFDLIFGIANASWDFNTNALGVNTNGIGWVADNGQVILNNSVVATISTYVVGDTLCIAPDFDNKKLWLRPASDPNWNDDVIGNQNPATNTGGIDFSGLAAGPYFLAVFHSGGDTSVKTLNTGATPFTETRPSGFFNFGNTDATIAEWEHTDIAASFVTAEQTLTTPQFDAITDFYDLFGELQADGGAAAYDPSADAGLVVWYKADDGPKDAGGNTPDNAETILTWQDRSSNADNLTRIGADAIVYNTNSLNSLPGVTSDGAVSSGLRSVNDAIALNSTTLTVIALLKSLTGGAAGGRVVSLRGSGPDPDYNNDRSFTMEQVGGTTEQLHVYGNSADIGPSPGFSFPFGTAATFTLQFNGTVARVFKSGVQQGSDRAWTGALGNTVIEYLSLFSNDGATSNAEMTLYEVIITTTVLDLSADGPVDAYFTNKWATY